MKQDESFVAHGIYTLSNSIGLEVQISDCGSGARWKYIDSNGGIEISEWQEIEHGIDENEEEYSFILCGQLVIKMNEVMRINN